ncbi:peptidoglycan-binding protein [Hahella sp. KA22]|uniref:FecR domain-containing protein n=1 Tax=Hahella sp. KA22 TaxID=1628392 RepID=UPI000FDF5F15|nr:FecR domain-containing protein [Hahella sp. KA22]AZZ91118.1 peptidoglycan-binding protein [Hahella sp. KA22]QAY54486.1 peptidoglycan-binding protein [Hahella sp. KA22]
MKQSKRHLLWFWFLCWFSFAGFAQEPDKMEWTYTTRPNDSLQSIGERFLAPNRGWDALMRYNSLNDAWSLTPGTQLRIPVAWLRHYPQSASLLNLRGKVWLRKAHTSHYVLATQEAKLEIGDEIKTDEGSALVGFADGSELTVSRQSIVIFNTLTHYGDTGMVDTRLRLLRGKMQQKVTPRRGPASRYEVSTPSAVAAVRGTAFRLRATADVTVAEVTEGVVEVSNATASRKLYKGQGATVGSGSVFSEIQLPEAPEVSASAVYNAAPVTLSWAPVTNATAYVIEVFKGDGKELPVFSQQIDAPLVELPDLGNGDYRLLLRAVDPGGLEGVDTEVRFRVEQKAEPAQLITPLTGALLREPRPVFRWRLDTPTQMSSLEISADPQFTALYTRTPFSSISSAQAERDLNAGEYFWRIATLAGGDDFSYSEPRRFTILGKLDDTHVIAVNYFDEKAKVFWKSVANADRYILQLAEDEFFSRVIEEQQVEKTSANLRLTPEKTYWIRIRPVAGPLYSSNFGAIQAVRIEP